VSLTLAHDCLVHKPIIFLKAKLTSYLELQTEEETVGLFMLLASTNQITHLEFKNTSKYKF